MIEIIKSKSGNIIIKADGRYRLELTDEEMNALIIWAIKDRNIPVIKDSYWHEEICVKS